MIEQGESWFKEAVMNSSSVLDSVLGTWPGVSSHPHRFGGREYRFGRREIGHVHGDYLVDIPFPKRVRDEVIALGLAQMHHVLPDSGWVSVPLYSEQDLERAISLLRRSYELAVSQKEKRQETK
jgi:hypothetical protein